MNNDEIDRLHRGIARMVREQGMSHGKLLLELANKAILVERGLEPAPREPSHADEVRRAFGLDRLEFELSSANRLSLNHGEQFARRPEEPYTRGKYTPRMEAPTQWRDDAPVPARGDSLTDPVGVPKFFSKPPASIWKGGDEEPSTSGEDEFSSLPAGQDDSKYVRRKFRSPRGERRGERHFGGFRNG
jgi:hypothetical protein